MVVVVELRRRRRRVGAVSACVAVGRLGTTSLCRRRRPGRTAVGVIRWWCLRLHRVLLPLLLRLLLRLLLLLLLLLLLRLALRADTPHQLVVAQQVEAAAAVLRVVLSHGALAAQVGAAHLEVALQAVLEERLGLEVG